MNIQKISADKLMYAEYNPRKDLKRGDAEYEKLKKSIESFGYVEPVIVNSDMTVVGGHQRVKVLKELGYAEIDCVVVNLDKKQEKTLNIALNKISGEWDSESLTALLDELSSNGVDMMSAGFDTEEIDALLSAGNYIDDLLNDDFVTSDRARKEFDVTFTLPLEYKSEVTAHIKANGKQPITDMIIQKIKGLI